MTPERFERINTVADAALRLPSAERIAFLLRACGGDEELRHRVELLLAAQESDDDFLDQPAFEVLAKDMAVSWKNRDALSGQSFDRYRILSCLGSGGIGEVWLARDTQLARDVALKLLSPGFGGEEQFLRLQQEARAASRLNHPNIVTIYEMGESGGVHFIAEEYVAGETLRRRIAMGPMPEEETITIAIQAAAALEAAHAADIVHRDVKPENIMIRPDGLVKLLDFGLARFTERERAAGNSREMSRRFVAGTVKYMSPEQARGLDVDARGDVFSLGVTLYEMLTGAPPFAGSSPSATLAAIVESEPAPLPRTLGRHDEIAKIVQKCLRKDPALRYRSAADLRLALIDYAKRIEASRDLPAGAARHRALTPARAAALLLPLAALAFALYLATAPKRPASPFNAMTIERLTTRGDVAGAALSPDAAMVAYATDEGDRQTLWLKRLDANRDVRLAPPEPYEHRGLAFSPDGRFLYYTRRDADGADALCRIPSRPAAANAAPPQIVLADVSGPIAFSPDGKRFAFVRLDRFRRDASLMVANADGMNQRTVATRRRPEYFSRSGVAWSPDGKTIACFAGNASYYTSDAFHLISVRLADGVERQIVPRAWLWVGPLAWSGDRLIVEAGEHLDGISQLWQVLYPGGEVRRVTNDLTGYSDLSVNANGSALVSVQKESSAALWLAPSGDANRAVRISPGTLPIIDSVAWTSDRRIVYSALTGEYRNIWITDAAGRNPQQLTDGPDDKAEIATTRNGDILYQSQGKIWRLHLDGSGRMQLTHGALDVHPAVSADGRRVVYCSFQDWSPVIGGKPTLWETSIDGGQPLPLGGAAMSLPQISPEGGRIAGVYFPGADPRFSPAKLAVIPFEGGPPLAILTPLPGHNGRVYWTHDGKALIWKATTAGVGNLWRQSLDGAPPVKLTNFRSDRIFDFAWSPDGRQLALSRGNVVSDVVLIRNFR